MGNKEYLEKRKDFKYYEFVKEKISAFEGESILDVGSKGTDMVLEGKYKKRYIVDLSENNLEGVESVKCNFLTYEPPHPTFSTVTCFQVLEHLDDNEVVEFAHKLYALAGKNLVISVPFLWRKNSCKHHKQDPVSLKKVSSWFPKKPTYYKIITEKHSLQSFIKPRIVLFWDKDENNKEKKVYSSGRDFIRKIKDKLIAS